MQDAKADGICAEGYGKMRGYDRDELINYYLTHPDWCLQRRFPSIRLLRTEFSDIEDRGVFVDKKFNGETLRRLVSPRAYGFTYRRNSPPERRTLR